ncbi:hypothetical protein V5740_06945 [Croceibacterium sp. TMG7-5b_MA50]|uniref:hypothetical protein n=1 Tax=Croceibacterium sp. TMG7-5b_MA50 TaxID=3121290 RepID=UPI003221D693
MADVFPGMIRRLRRISRLFVIRTRFEAFAIIYALALGATQRGSVYLDQFPGWGGRLLFGACCLAVLMAGAKILDCLKLEAAAADRDKPG